MGALVREQGLARLQVCSPDVGGQGVDTAERGGVVEPVGVGRDGDGPTAKDGGGGGGAALGERDLQVGELVQLGCCRCF